MTKISIFSALYVFRAVKYMLIIYLMLILCRRHTILSAFEVLQNISEQNNTIQNKSVFNCNRCSPSIQREYSFNVGETTYFKTLTLFFIIFPSRSAVQYS